MRQSGRSDAAACREVWRADVAWLDLAAAAEAESGRAAADEMVGERVVDRVDEDLTPCTEAVIYRRGWLAG